MRYNNNTSSGHIKHPKKAYQAPLYADERKEAAWIAKLNEHIRKNQGRP